MATVALREQELIWLLSDSAQATSHVQTGCAKHHPSWVGAYGCVGSGILFIAHARRHRHIVEEEATVAVSGLAPHCASSCSDFTMVVAPGLGEGVARVRGVVGGWSIRAVAELVKGGGKPLVFGLPRVGRIHGLRL